MPKQDIENKLDAEYLERKASWEKQIEDVCCEMIKETTEEGILLLIDVMPIAKAFTNALNQMDSARISNKYIIKPGNKNDYS